LTTDFAKSLTIKGATINPATAKATGSNSLKIEPEYCPTLLIKSEDEGKVIHIILSFLFYRPLSRFMLFKKIFYKINEWFQKNYSKDSAKNQDQYWE
jgi:hypothetical protein